MSPDPPALDPERFGELEEDFGPEDVREVVQTFLDVTPPLVDELAEGSSVVRAGEIAHKLRGGCLAVGAMPLADVAARIERDARDGRIDPEQVAAAVRWWGATRQELLLRIA